MKGFGSNRQMSSSETWSCIFKLQKQNLLTLGGTLWPIKTTKITANTLLLLFYSTAVTTTVVVLAAATATVVVVAVAAAATKVMVMIINGARLFKIFTSSAKSGLNVELKSKEVA